MAVKILPYKLGSKSAKELARRLNVKRIIPGGGYRPSRWTTVVNWGSSRADFYHPKMLNKPESVAVASNKLSTLTKLKSAGIAVPDFTTDPTVAEGWLRDDYRVVVRHKLSAHSGQGIQVVRPGGRLPHAPLYTKYTRKDQEFRVHVFQGRVIDYSEKRRRTGMEYSEGDASLIRNHENGWVFCRTGVSLPTFVTDMSVRAVKALGLDFGALDVIVRNGKCWVVEVNTAPGIEGSTLERYVEAIRRLG